jgi:hypothetical protein
MLYQLATELQQVNPCKSGSPSADRNRCDSRHIRCAGGCISLAEIASQRIRSGGRGQASPLPIAGRSSSGRLVQLRHHLRLIPIALSREFRVVGLMPSSSAAPSGPWILPPDVSNARWRFSRSNLRTWASVRTSAALGLAPTEGACVGASSSTRSEPPRCTPRA